MNSEARKILKRLDYNKRAWTFDDVERCCDLCGVELDVVPMRKLGFFWMPDGVPSIVLSDSLRGIEKLIVSAHELGHYFSASPEAALYSPEGHNQREFQADKFAIIALIPLPLLRRMTAQYSLWDLQEEYGYDAEKFMFRQRIWQQCSE